MYGCRGVAEAMKMRNIKKLFREEDVIQALKSGPKTLKQIASAVGCSENTAWKLINTLMDKKVVDRINLGSRKKPFWLYHLAGEEKTPSPGKEVVMEPKIDTVVRRKPRLEDIGVRL